MFAMKVNKRFLCRLQAHGEVILMHHFVLVILLSNYKNISQFGPSYHHFLWQSGKMDSKCLKTTRNNPQILTHSIGKQP